MKTRSLSLLFLVAGLAASSSQAQSFVGTNTPGQTTNFTFTLAAGATNLSLVISNSAAAYSWLFLTNGSIAPTPAGYEFTSRLAGLTNQINLEAPEFATGAYSLLVSTPAASALQSFNVVLTTNLTNLRTASYPVSKPLVFSTTGFLTNSGTGQWQYFQVDMPSNLLTGWRVVLSSTNSTTPGLYIQRGQLPTTGSYVLAAGPGNPVDTATFTTNLSTAGTYFIGVYLPSGTASSAYYTLGAELASVTTLAWDPGTTQAGSQVYNNQSTPGGDYFFAINTLTTASGVWRNALNVQSGQAYLYLQQGTLPTTGSYGFASTLAGSNGFVLAQGPQFTPGQNWYLLVHATPNAQWNLVTGEAYVQQLPPLATDASSGATVTMGAEGMAFFKTTVPTGTLAWRLGLNGLANQLYVKSTLAPTPLNTSTYDLTQPGQMLVVPTYLKSGSQYFAGVVGSPGLNFTLDSRQQPVTTVPFNSTTPLNVTGYGYTTFLVQVPIQQIAWQINVTPTSGYAAVAANLGSVPNEFVNAAFSEAPAGVGDSISLVPAPSNYGAGAPGLSAGTWYITVYGTAPYTCSLFNGNPVITTVNYVFNITNDAPTRVGWRFYQILNSDLEQVDSLGWELDLSNAIPGAEIAIRRNAVPGAWNYRNDPYDYYPYSTTGYVDLSSTLGFLQQPNHQADVWYIGVYTPNTALGNFVLTGSQLVANPVSFDGSGNVTNVVNQPSSKWDYFIFTVPANSLGWDLRITNVTSGTPYMYVCRDQLPSTSPAGGINATFGSWPSGDQWTVGGDWTGDEYDPNITTAYTGQYEYGRVLALGMGDPLQAGTYYVGVVNTSGSSPMSYTLASRGIGTGFSIPVTPLNFTNGPTITASQLARNADYYSVVVPTNTTSWRVELDTNLGNVALLINENALPSSAPYGNYPPYDEYGGFEMNRVGDQQYLMTPEYSGTNIRAGTYYLAVVSQGTNSVQGSILGGGSSSYTLGSYGSLTVTNIGTVDPTGNTDLLETNNLSKAGQISAYSFNVPPNTLSLEIFLTNTTGTPYMTLLTGHQLPSAYDGYGNTGGQGNTWYNSTLINIPNPTVTNYTLMVQAVQSGGDASYVVRVHAIGPTPVAFDGPGNTGTITNQPAGVWQYFTITVPATPLGWDLRLTNVTYSNSQEPRMYVSRDVAPSFSSSGVNATFGSWPSGYEWTVGGDWTGDEYDPNITTAYTGQYEYGWVLALGMGDPLQAGTYLVGVINNNTGTNLISYTLASRGIGTGFSIPVTPLNFTNGPTITASQLARNADYYSVVVPTNTTSWRVELDTNLGNVALLINENALPSSAPYGNYPPYDEYGGFEMNRVGDQQYLMTPEYSGTNIRAGTYYLAVVSQGTNSVQGSILGGGSSSYTLGSYGSLTVTNIGTVDPTGNTDLLETNNLSKAGQISAYSFNVPPNTLSLEIFLTNTTGTPYMTLLTGHQLPSAYDGYGNTGGQGNTWYNSTLINIPNPTVTNYTLMVQAVQSGGDASYVVRVHAIGPTPVAFDGPGNTGTITNQPAGVWQYFTITVPATPLGWDLRLTNVTYSNSQEPRMYVSRDVAPSFSSSGVNATFGSWPSGYEWTVGGDWTGDEYDPNITTAYTGQYEYGWVLALGMGDPLQAGTYLVGVINNNTGTNLISYTLASRGIGTGFSIPVTPLNFTNGIITNTIGLNPRQADYYSVVVPTNTWNWKVRLTDVSGETALLINENALPSSAPYGNYPPYDEYGGYELNKPGNEQYLMLPVNAQSGSSNIMAGTYYLAVIGQGQNPGSSIIGTNSSIYILDSFGVEGITNLGPVTATDILQTNAIQGGENALYQFSIPPGWPAVEVRLDNVTASPYMSLQIGTNDVQAYYGYGYTGGVGAGWNSPSLITLPNPTVTNYSLTVQASYNSTANAYLDANFTVHIRPMPTPPLAFDPSLNNANGIINTASGSLLDGQSAFYQVTVPATLNNQPVIGWKLTLAQTLGSPSVRVRPSLLPDNGGCDGTSPFSTSQAIIVPTYLTPGTWYVEVRATGATTYTITSSNLFLNRPAWTMQPIGGTVTTPGLSAPFFADTGIDASGNPLPGDQGSDLAQGNFDYYEIIVPPNNTGVLRTRLDAISGNPNLYLRAGAPSTLSHYSGGSCGSTLYDRSLTASAFSEYGNWVPLDGRHQAALTSGPWYLAVQATGNSNVRYRLRMDTGSISNLSLAGGSFTSQSLVSGDWLYYAAYIPTNAPVNWNVTYAVQLGNVVVHVRDTSPPGFATTINDLRDWNYDNKNHGPYPVFSSPGTYTLTTPPLRPGVTNYLGFEATSDAIFSVSCTTNGGSINYTNTLAFYGGYTTNQIPAFGQLKFRIDVPPDATEWIDTTVHSNSVWLFLDQGSAPTLTTSDDWYSENSANQGLDQSLKNLASWPWLPAYSYFLSVTNTSAITQPFSFSMFGVYPEAGPVDFISGSMLPNRGGFQMTMQVNPGWTYQLQYSTDLFNWYGVTSFTPATGTITYTDTSAPFYPARFYRLVPQ